MEGVYLMAQQLHHPHDPDYLLPDPEDVRGFEREVVESLLDRYAFNSCEICRAVNGREPGDSIGCFEPFSYEAKPSRCRARARGCAILSQTVYMRLRRMEARGLIKSVKMRWVDGRDEGCFKESIQWDTFRIWYLTRQGLGNKLIHDCISALGGDLT